MFRLGKSEITPEITKGIDEALEARELVKIDILQNCDIDPKYAAEIVAERTKSEVVTVIGRRFVLYRKKKPAKNTTAKPEIKKPLKKTAKKPEIKLGRNSA
ncbi:MAG: YhbY family RNA-binding protein [Defluviitaleaceae bacterium]|nr:YhbY family RNA-binding protein [Defluviitaleaceae bacterium]